MRILIYSFILTAFAYGLHYFEAGMGAYAFLMLCAVLLIGDVDGGLL